MSPTVDLAYVGLGVHEQLVASVAHGEGHFREEGVEVALHDGRRWPTERLRHGAVVGLGRTQVSRLRDGVPWAIVWVNTDRPMFWLIAQPELNAVSDLRHRRVGVHDATSAPGLWARIVLRRHGLDPDRDITPVVIPAGDYSTHVRMLRAGTLDAAVIGSTVSPEKLAAEDGLRTLTFFGDEIRIPTTGVAVDPSVIDPGGSVARAVVGGHRRAVEMILEQPDVAIDHIGRLVPGLDDGEVAAFYERYVKRHFFEHGKADAEIVRQGLARLAAELGAATEVPPLAELYRNGFWADGRPGEEHP